MTRSHPTLDALRGRLVVSCQAYPGEPMRHPDTIRRIAQAAALGGAAGVRIQGLDDIRAVRAHLDVPVIGLWKDGDADVVITPTLDHAVQVAAAGANVVALDGTSRERPDGRSLAETIASLKAATGCLVMADCSTSEEGVAAADVGADAVGTTLSGYTSYSRQGPGPDLALVERLSDALDVPVVAEGRIHTPAQAAAAMQAGAWAVVVGTAITHPTTITSWFIDAVQPARAATRKPSSADARSRARDQGAT